MPLMASCPQFVAHPNVQQLLASIWYEGLPGFRQKNMLLQVRLISPRHNVMFKQQRAFNLKLQGLEVCRMGLLFPVFSVCYIVTPWWSFSQTMRKPFIKFICNSSSYFTFLCKSNCHWEWVVRAFAPCLLGLHKRLLVFWLEFLLLFHTPINSSLNEIINQVSHARRSQDYLLCAVLLILASQRIEDIVGWDLTTDTTKRGSLPSVVEYCILAYVAGEWFL